MKLKEKSAVVTGAAHGIGRAIALRFVEEGATVYALDRDERALAELSGVASSAGRITAVVCDCADEGSVSAAAARIPDGGAVDVLVNNAGINPSPRSLTETEPADWDDIIEGNLRSVYLVSHALIPRMARGGSVVNLGSILGLTGVKSCSAYTASKGAIIALTRSMARDYAPDLRVNCICPGAIETEMFETYLARSADPEAERRRIASAIPLGRLGTPEDIAQAALYLASAESSFITGTILAVDGGDSS
ncbi:MAG: hypothetical protein AMS21_08120 [Gemmatimonas sp. SG8_38_2]|nr:MAG: hypothetical protein AMS21_08120 [Gemmatimonas sp. SG8_38_2]